MATYDTAALLSAIRREARAPDATASGWADSDLLARANAEVRQYIAPRLLRAREEFLVAVKDVSLVAGTEAYALPSRAILGKLREVQLVASDGNHRNLPQGTPERLHGQDTTGNNGTPSFYFFRGHEVVLVPPPDASDYPTLRLHYFRRLNRLVATSDVLTVTDVASAPQYDGTKPSGITTSTPCDVVSGTEPFPSRSDDVTPSAVAAGYVTFSSAVSGAAAGDYICLAGEAPVLQLPPEFFDLLVLKTAMGLLGGGVDAEARDELAERLKDTEANIFGALSGDRNEGETEAIVNGTWG